MILGVDCAGVDKNNSDWTKAKSTGHIGFALIRATYGAALDSLFNRDWPSIKALGVPVGAYLFLRYGANLPSAQDQALAFIDVVGALEPSCFPPIIDIEFEGAGRKAAGISIDDAMASIRAAWNTLLDHYEAPPVIYTSYRVWFEELSNVAAADLVESPLWLAKPWPWATDTEAHLDGAYFDDGQHDPAVPTPWRKQWFIHQYQGDALGFPGFNSTVDLNRFRVSRRGANGDHVRWIQRRLRIAETGTFDDDVETEVIAYQHANDLVADGVVGPRTFSRLCWE